MLGVGATPAEAARPLPGDDVVPDADVVMDRGFTVDAAPEEVWPWLAQLGEQRAGWYLPGPVERFLPAGRRASRVLLPHALVYRSARGRGGRVAVSWAIVLAPYGERTRAPLPRLSCQPRRSTCHQRRRSTDAGGNSTHPSGNSTSRDAGRPRE